MGLQAETAKFHYADRAKVSKWQKICFAKSSKRVRIIHTQEVEVLTLLEVINRVVINSNNSSRMEDISNMEVTISNSSTDKEDMVKILGTVVLHKPSRISSKVNSNR